MNSFAWLRYASDTRSGAWSGIVDRSRWPYWPCRSALARRPSSSASCTASLSTRFPSPTPRVWFISSFMRPIGRVVRLVSRDGICRLPCPESRLQRRPRRCQSRGAVFAGELDLPGPRSVAKERAGRPTVVSRKPASDTCPEGRSSFSDFSTRCACSLAWPPPHRASASRCGVAELPRWRLMAPHRQPNGGRIGFRRRRVPPVRPGCLSSLDVCCRRTTFRVDGE